MRLGSRRRHLPQTSLLRGAAALAALLCLGGGGPGGDMARREASSAWAGRGGTAPCSSSSSSSSVWLMPSIMQTALMMPLPLPTLFAVAAAADDDGEDMPSDEEMKGINTVVQETSVMRMLKAQAARHEADLKALRKTVTDELGRLHTHFEGVVATMEQKEMLLKNHIDAVEKKLRARLANEKFKATGEGQAVDEGNDNTGGDAAAARGSKLPPPPTSHFWPFLFLFVLMCGCGLFGMKQIRKLQTENDYWGSMRRASSGSFDSATRKRSF